MASARIDQEQPSGTKWLVLVGFGATLTLFMSLLGYGVIQVDHIHANVHDIVDSTNRKEYLIQEMQNASRGRLLDLLIMTDEEDPFLRDELHMTLRGRGARFLRAREDFFALSVSDEERGLFDEQLAATMASAPVLRQVADLVAENKLGQARTLLKEQGVPLQKQVIESLNRIAELQRSQASETLQNTDRQHARARTLMVALGLVAGISSLLIAIVVSRRILTAEKSLFAEKERAQVTLCGIGDGVLSLSPERRISYLNPKAMTLLGTTPESALGRPIEALRDFHLPHIESPLTDVLGHALDTEARSQALWTQGTDGEQIWVETFADSLSAQDGSSNGYVLVIRDITDARKSELQLRQLNASLESRVHERTRELEEAFTNLQETQAQLIQSEKLASLGGLVAGISHEVNTPIGIGVTSASNLQERLQLLQEQFDQGKLTRTNMGAYLEHAQQGHQILLSNLQRAADLIRSFKQVAVDQSSEECREIELHGYCDEIITSLRPKLKNRPVEVNNLCETGFIYTHPGATYQIISNLIINSLIHGFDAQQPGTIDIRGHITPERVTLDYQDNGRGIPEHLLNRVFEPFVTTRRGDGGSGLGLSIVYNLVTSTLGGRISIKNRQDGGVHFLIDFPRRSADSDQEQPVA